MCSEGNPLAAVGAPHAPFEAPAVYLAWWAEVEACSQKTADFGRVDWRLVDAGPDGTFTYGRRTAVGAWESPHSIYISDGWVLTEPLVKHEMLHDLLQSANHLDQAFFVCGLLDI
jgi:hypothetical protein